MYFKISFLLDKISLCELELGENEFFLYLFGIIMFMKKILRKIENTTKSNP